MKYLTILLLIASLTAKAQDSTFQIKPPGWSFSTVWEWCPDSLRLVSKEAYVNIRLDGEYKRPVHFILANDTLRMSLDPMFLDLIKRAKVIEVGRVRFELETKDRQYLFGTYYLLRKDDPEYIISKSVEQNWYTPGKLKIIKRKPNKRK
jgi:hypothetical protein